MNIVYTPIGIIKTEFESMVGVPIQPSFGKERTGFIELMPQYTDGLKDLMDISHVYLLYHFDRHQDFKLGETLYG